MVGFSLLPSVWRHTEGGAGSEHSGGGRRRRVAPPRPLFKRGPQSSEVRPCTKCTTEAVREVERKSVLIIINNKASAGRRLLRIDILCTCICLK